MPVRRWARAAQLLVLCFVVTAPAAAQSLPTAPSLSTAQIPSVPASPAAAQQAPPPTAAEIDRLIAFLSDPVARDALVADLQAMRDAMPEPATTQPLLDAATVAGVVSREIDARIGTLARLGETLSRTAAQAPNLWAWLAQQVRDPDRRSFWVDVAGRIGLLVAIGTIALQLVRVGILPWTRRLATIEPATQSERLRVATLRLLLAILPPVSFVAAATLALAVTAVDPLLRDAAQSLVLAFFAGRIVAIVTAVVLAPHSTTQRLVQLGDDDAADLARGLRFGAGGFIWGHLTLDAATVLGLPLPVENLLAHVVNLASILLLALTMLRCRQGVGERIAAIGADSRSLLSGLVPWSSLATVWHLLATGWLLLLYVVWAVQVPGGTRYLVIGTAATIGLAVASRALVAVIHRRMADPPAGEGDSVEALPTGADRVARYRPWLRVGLVWTVRLVALVLVLEAWQLGAFAKLRTDTGQALLGVLLRLLLIGGLAIVAWETVSVGIGRYLAARDRDGNLTLSNRTRTILAISRNALLVLVALVAGMLALSEIGVNTAPLLAGAGVIGLAIGFGSQRLVQDIITGLFILLGDTMRVGDVVDVGGKSGVVESMTMRAVSLRGYDGSVFTLPYSGITGITNFTKDFSCWVVQATVPYETDLDRATAILRGIVDQMRLEWPWRRSILEPLEVAGLDRFGEASVVLQARIKTRPGAQWDIGREFNRRMKQAFDAAGIGTPVPRHSVQVVDAGDAVPEARAAAAAAI